MTLGLSLWAVPGAATPNRDEVPRGLAVASAAHAARNVDVQLRKDWKEVAGLYQRQAANGLIPSRSVPGRDWKDEWHSTTKPGQVGSAVPEPSAMTLFGVGLLLTLQAIPRRGRTSSADVEVGGSPEVA
jgi:hypothetical protein